MSIVSDRYNQTKPVQVDPKTGKPLPATQQKQGETSQSLDQSDSGFFGSFFANKNEKRQAAMEAVSRSQDQEG